MTVAELEEDVTHDDLPSRIDPLDVPKGYELIDGELVEMPEMGYESSWITSELHFQIRSYLASHPIGVSATAEASFSCFPGRPKLVRKPDVSVVLCDPTTYQIPRVNCTVVPALVVEVVSPHDKLVDIDARVRDFLRAGTQLAWVVNPDARTVMIYRADGSVQLLCDPATLSGESVLPGFSIPLASFLPPVREPAP
jgi:Uma2 family endonuclease